MAVTAADAPSTERPKLESVTIGSSPLDTNDIGDAISDAIDDVAAPDVETSRQSLRDAIYHLEQAVSILKTVLDED